MTKRNLLLLIFILATIIIALFIYFYQIPVEKKKVKIDETKIEEKSFTSNIIQNVKYTSKDVRGNEYIITAREGEIDINNDNVIFLKVLRLK